MILESLPCSNLVLVPVAFLDIIIFCFVWSCMGSYHNSHIQTEEGLMIYQLIASLYCCVMFNKQHEVASCTLQPRNRTPALHVLAACADARGWAGISRSKERGCHLARNKRKFQKNKEKKREKRGKRGWNWWQLQLVFLCSLFCREARVWGRTKLSMTCRWKQWCKAWEAPSDMGMATSWPRKYVQSRFGNSKTLAGFEDFLKWDGTISEVQWLLSETCGFLGWGNIHPETARDSRGCNLLVCAEYFNRQLDQMDFREG